MAKSPGRDNLHQSQLMRYGTRISILILAAGAVSASAIAQDNMTLSERVERLERQVGSGGGGSVADLLMQVRRLEQEVRELRGQVEQQQHEIESLKARQRDQYLDLDRRLQSLSSGGAASSGGSGGAQQVRQGRQAQVQTGPGEVGDADNPVERGASPAQDAADARAPVADAEARQKAYDAAFSKLRDGEYAAAAEGFRSFLDQFPDGPLADNAQYWLGESYYVTGNFDIALNAFQAVTNRFAQSPKAPDALLKLGFCYYELEQWDQARQTLEQVQQQYPDSSVARLARDRLRSMRIDGH